MTNEKYIVYANFQEGASFRCALTVLKPINSTNLLFTKDAILVYAGRKDRNVNYIWSIYAKDKLLSYYYDSNEVQKSMKSRRFKGDIPDDNETLLSIDLEKGQEAMPVGVMINNIIEASTQIKTDGFELYIRTDDNELSLHKITPGAVTNEFPVHKIETHEIEVEMGFDVVYEVEGLKKRPNEFHSAIQDVLRKKCTNFIIQYDVINQNIYFAGSEKMDKIKHSNKPSHVSDSQLRVFYVGKEEIKGWVKIQKMAPPSGLIKFFVEDDKPLKISIPCGMYSTFDILVAETYKNTTNKKERHKKSK